MSSNVASAVCRVLSAGAFAALVAGLSGCAHQVYNVKIDAIQNPEVATGFSYRIVDKVAGEHSPDPRHDEAVGAVRFALASRGLYEAPDPARAELEVSVEYGMGPQRLKLERPTPGLPPTAASAPLALVPVRLANGSTSYAAISADKLDADGTYRGMSVIRGAYVCDKFLFISARVTPFAAGPGRETAEAWQVQVTVEDTADSLDGYIPILAEAATDYLGTSTAKREHVKLRAEDMIALARADR